MARKHLQNKTHPPQHTHTNQTTWLPCHTTNSNKGAPLSVDHILYIDIGPFISTTRDRIQSITQALYDHLAKLKMHIRKNNKESKTLAMLIWPSLKQAKENIIICFLKFSIFQQRFVSKYSTVVLVPGVVRQRRHEGFVFHYLYSVT